MEQEAIIERLDKIEEALKNIQETISDPDTILTEEEREMLDQSIINQREGKLISMEDLRKKLDL
jgi:hypothetical protein